MALPAARQTLTRATIGACLALVGLALWQPAGSAQPGGDTESVEVPTGVEAWYNTTPLPVGDLPVVPPPTNPYEEDTLHVRITGGQENARTYISLDLKRLPVGTEISDGLLSLPLAPSEKETDDDRSARLWICLADPLDEKVSGSFEQPPKVDCESRSGATYVRKPRPHFIVDLAPFVDFLQTNSLAVLPSDVAREKGDTWHVSFYGKKNDTKSANPVTAELVIAEVSGLAAAPPPVPPVNPDPAPPADSGFGSGSLNIGMPPPTQPLNDAPAPPSSDRLGSRTPATRNPQPVAAPPAEPTAAEGPSYTAVWALPLLLLLLAGYFSSALTRDIVVSRLSDDS